MGRRSDRGYLRSSNASRRLRLSCEANERTWLLGKQTDGGSARCRFRNSPKFPVVRSSFALPERCAFADFLNIPPPAHPPEASPSLEHRPLPPQRRLPLPPVPMPDEEPHYEEAKPPAPPTAPKPSKLKSGRLILYVALFKKNDHHLTTKIVQCTVVLELYFSSMQNCTIF